MPSSDPNGRVSTILLVDDEPAIRLIAGRVLQRAGHTVISAGDGAEALRLAVGFPARIDLVVSDLSMPFMDGFELIRTLQRFSHPKVLIMSGYPEDSEGESHWHWILKPFQPGELAAMVAEILMMQEAP